MPTEKKNLKPNPMLEAMISQYNQNQQSSSSSKKSYDLKNYFTPRLSDKEKTGTKRIRIVPDHEGGTPFKEVYIHKIQIKGEWKKFICLNHMFDKDCPFCEAREALLASGKDSDKELAKQYGAKRAYVVKVVDRDAEDDGVKFWRFMHDYRNEGIFDKIIGIIKTRGDKGNIADPETGRDLIIDLGKNQHNATIVKSIVDDDPSPISEDADQAKEWLEDARTWENIYSIRNYEYLEIVVLGGEPTWDKAKNKWVNKADLVDAEAADVDNALTTGGGDAPEDEVTEEPAVVQEQQKTEKLEKAEKPAKTPKVKTVKPQAPEDEDVDDMPF